MSMKKAHWRFTVAMTALIWPASAAWSQVSAPEVGTAQPAPVSQTPAATADEEARAGPPRGAVEASMGEILVIARKRDRAEEIQDVPIAITAFDAARLEVRGFDNIQDISFSMPNVALDTIGSAPTSAGFSIRGLSTTSSIQSLEPAVGMFVDGVYLAVLTGVVSDTFDIGSIEILRGPQGTLFGRNVTGGAVLVNTKRPSQDFGVEGVARLTTGLSSPAGMEYTAGLAVTGPLTSTISARLAGYFRKDHGYARNRANKFLPTLNGGDSRLPNSETWFVRPSILWEPTDNFSALLRYEHFEHDGTMLPNQNQANFDPDSFGFAINYLGLSKTNVDNVTGEINLEIGPGTITNIANYRKMHDVFGNDLDGTINTAFHLTQFTGSEQYSDELRYAGTIGILDFTIGGYAYRANLEQIEARLLGTLVQSGGGRQKTTSYAVFTENQVHLTDKLTGLFGIRYTHERKKAAITQISAAAKCGNTFPVLGSRPCIVDAVDSDSWGLLGFKGGLEYEFNAEVMAYATFTRGFRSGGYNIRQAVSFSPLPFDEEQVDAYEVGLKSTYLDGRMRTNVAFFWNDVSDFQRTISVAVPVPPFTIQTTQNAAGARFRGFEFDQAFKVTDQFLLSGYVGYIDAEYTSLNADVNGDGVINNRDFALELPRAPEWSYGAQVAYDLPVGENLVSAVVSVDHRAHTFFTDSNLGRMPAITMLNGRLSYAMANGVKFALFGQNLLNEVVHGSLTPIGALFDASGRFPIRTDPSIGPAPTGTLSPIVQRPRTIGLEVNFSF